ncbi:hypothetical protein V565_246340, partial [Rhizoctonia solani 123E]
MHSSTASLTSFPETAFSLAGVLPGAPPEATYEDTLKLLQSWVETSADSKENGTPYKERITVPNIDHSVAEKVFQKISLGDNKVRFNWSVIGNTAVFDMPKAPHDLPGNWMMMVLPQIDDALMRTATCGNPSVCPTGTHDVYLATAGKKGKKTKYLTGTIAGKNTGSHFQPDASFHLQYLNDKGDATYASPRPRVILETAFSDKLTDTQDKACEYLYNTDGDIHAVIICNMSHPIPKQGFKAEISVWVRAPNENYTDIPVDPCQSPQGVHKGEPIESMDNRSHVSITSENVPVPSIYRHAGDVNNRYLIMNRSGWQ